MPRKFIIVKTLEIETVKDISIEDLCDYIQSQDEKDMDTMLALYNDTGDELEFSINKVNNIVREQE